MLKVDQRPNFSLPTYHQCTILHRKAICVDLQISQNICSLFKKHAHNAPKLAQLAVASMTGSPLSQPPNPVEAILEIFQETIKYSLEPEAKCHEDTRTCCYQMLAGLNARAEDAFFPENEQLLRNIGVSKVAALVLHIIRFPHTIPPCGNGALFPILPELVTELGPNKVLLFLKVIRSKELPVTTLGRESVNFHFYLRLTHQKACEILLAIAKHSEALYLYEEVEELEPYLLLPLRRIVEGYLGVGMKQIYRELLKEASYLNMRDEALASMYSQMIDTLTNRTEFTPVEKKLIFATLPTPKLVRQKGTDFNRIPW